MKFFLVNLLQVAVLATACLGQSTEEPEPGPGLQLDFWKLGSHPFGQQCVRYGNNPGLPGLPIFDDPWFLLLTTCDSHFGSVSCFNEEDMDGMMVGTCGCNQGEDQEYIENGDKPICAGKVGAICTTEQTSFIPEKSCLPNSHCVPEQGEGHSVGRCECLYGYYPDAGRHCVRNESIGDGDVSTPRTTTTPTENPNKGELQLPLDLLTGLMRFVGVNDSCNSAAVLNKTYCNPPGMTVSCLDKKCQCNTGDDSIFDEDLNLCVGLAGSYCLTRKNLLGWKGCTKGADCFVENGTSEDEYSFGTCQCMYGYLEDDYERTCFPDPNVSDPSTRRPGVGPTPPTPPPADPTTPTYPPSGAETVVSQNLALLIITTLFMTFAGTYNS